MVNLAYSAVQKRIEDGTASAMELVHFLKIGTTEHELQMRLLEAENELRAAKKAELESRQNVEELYKNALAAMRSYRGAPEDDDEEL